MRRKTGHEVIDAHQGVIIASDEAGYGSWCGPLVVCAIAAPMGWVGAVGATDSKDLTPAARQKVMQAYKNDKSLTIRIVVVSAKDVDEEGVYKAVIRAHGRAQREVYAAVCEALCGKGVERNLDTDEGREFWASIEAAAAEVRTWPEAKRSGSNVASTRIIPPKILGVVDGNLPITRMNLTHEAVALPKADSLVPECSLASIFAKETHDALIREIAAKYPGYDLENNMGYGGGAASKHATALRTLGPCPEHRRSYQPVAEAIEMLETQ